MIWYNKLQLCKGFFFMHLFDMLLDHLELECHPELVNNRNNFSGLGQIYTIQAKLILLCVWAGQVVLCSAKCRIFSEKYCYYLQAQTDMPFHYLKLIIWSFNLFLLLMSVGSAWKSATKQKQIKYNFKNL